MEREHLVEEDPGGVRRALPDGQPQRILLLLELRDRSDAGPLVDDHDEAVPRRVGRDDAHRERRGEEAGAPVRLREAPGRVQERHLDAAVHDGVCEQRRERTRWLHMMRRTVK